VCDPCLAEKRERKSRTPTYVAKNNIGSDGAEPSRKKGGGGKKDHCRNRQSEKPGGKRRKRYLPSRRRKRYNG